MLSVYNSLHHDWWDSVFNYRSKTTKMEADFEVDGNIDIVGLEESNRTSNHRTARILKRIQSNSQQEQEVGTGTQYKVVTISSWNLRIILSLFVFSS